MIPPLFALVAFIPLVLAIFATMPARRAVLIAVFAGTLFLPEAISTKLPLIEFNKGSAISIALLLGVALFDGNRLLSFRFAWYDSFCAAMCVLPFFTSMSNDLGAKDGLVECASMIMTWGVSYLIGRLYMTDLDGLREAAIAFVIAGVIYAPLCLIEIRLSPQLHMWTYGFAQHAFSQTIRFGGYRPMVFMRHGLEVGLFMASAAVIALALWRYAGMKKLLGLPLAWIVGGLYVVTVLCKSSGSIALMALATAVLVAAEFWRSSIPLIAIVAIAPLYIVTRTAGLFDGNSLVAMSASVLNEERAGSLRFRLDNEDLVIVRALERPLLGWGGFDRSRPVRQYNSGNLAVLDGLWITALGRRGILCVAALFGAFLIGPLLLRRRIDPSLWTHPAVVPAFAGAIVVVTHMIDCIPNGMPNPMFFVIGGGLAGLVAAPRTASVNSAAQASYPTFAPQRPHASLIPARPTPVAGR